jgi:pyruvate/2-oxoglutarate dehydrogenase complex dihydrolipoamide acyltransferase (E2) component
VTELCFPGGDPRAAAGGVVARWLVEEGGRVQVGQRLAEVRWLGGGSTDWIPALATGTLWRQVREGEVLIPGAVVGLIE